MGTRRLLYPSYGLGCVMPAIGIGIEIGIPISIFGSFPRSGEILPES